MKVFRVDRFDYTAICLFPKIPKNLSHGEDNTTMRICCSPSINGCLSAISNLDYREILYVYEYECEIDDLYQPTEKQVYDVFLTGEMWILQSVTFKKIGSLEIIGYIGQYYKDRVNNQYAFNFIEMIKE